MNPKYDELRNLCLKENLKLPKYDLVFFTFGNVSVADRKNDVMAIKPSGVEYSELQMNDIVVLKISDGSILDGYMKPSSDTNTHLELYRAFPKIMSITHTHSTFAACWAQSGRDVPIYGTTHADYLPCAVPCTEFLSEKRISEDYETETGRLIVECFQKRGLNPDDIPMVLVAGHGPFTWGLSEGKSVYHAKILEEIAHMG